MFSVTSAINVAAMVQHKIQSTHIHTASHTRYKLIHTSRQPLYLIGCLPLLLFHSLCLTDTMRIQRHEKKLVIKGQYAFVCIHMRGQREREMQKETGRRKDWVKRQKANKIKISILSTVPFSVNRKTETHPEVVKLLLLVVAYTGY